MMRRREPHRERVRIVVVAEVGLLDLHMLQAGFVEQMAREFRAGAGQVGTVAGMLGQHMAHPPLRAEHRR